MAEFTLRIKNFRVLTQLDWSPKGVCLLSGANGAGKTTALDALLFLRTRSPVDYERRRRLAA